MGQCSDPEIFETLQTDLELHKTMVNQDRSLFDAVREAGDVFFEADDNRLCFYNSLSEAYHAAQNFEAKQLSALEIWQGIRETLAGAAQNLSHSTEKRLRILQVYAMLSDAANYMELDEFAHSGAAIFLNMEIIVVTGTYIFSKNCTDAATILGLSPPSGLAIGKAKLLLRGPRSHEEMGVKRHYNAALCQGRVDSSSVRKRGPVNADEDADDRHAETGGGRKNHRVAANATSSQTSHTPEILGRPTTLDDRRYEHREGGKAVDVSGLLDKFSKFSVSESETLFCRRNLRYSRRYKCLKQKR